MKTRIQNSNLFATLSLIVFGLAIAQFVFAADKKQARVTEVIRDVHLLAKQAAARPAAVNDTVREGTAVRTGTDSRAELTFADLTLTRLGANTVFTFGGGAHTYDLGSGAILMTAPAQAGTIKINTAIATCAVSGFTAIFEGHRDNWNKVIVLEGDGSVALKKNPTDHRHMHSSQMLVFRPDATVLPQPVDITVCGMISNGLLIRGFKNQLPSMPLLVDQCSRQQAQPNKSHLIDPTSQNTIDQSINALPSATPPPPRPTPDGDLMPKRHP